VLQWALQQKLVFSREALDQLYLSAEQGSAPAVRFWAHVVTNPSLLPALDPRMCQAGCGAPGWPNFGGRCLECSRAKPTPRVRLRNMAPELLAAESDLQLIRLLMERGVPPKLDWDNLASVAVATRQMDLLWWAFSRKAQTDPDGDSTVRQIVSLASDRERKLRNWSLLLWWLQRTPQLLHKHLMKLWSETSSWEIEPSEALLAFRRELHTRLWPNALLI
jgi:hypothetical protein